MSISIATSARPELPPVELAKVHRIVFEGWRRQTDGTGKRSEVTDNHGQTCYLPGIHRGVCSYRDVVRYLKIIRNDRTNSGAMNHFRSGHK